MFEVIIKTVVREIVPESSVVDIHVSVNFARRSYSLASVSLGNTLGVVGVRLVHMITGELEHTTLAIRKPLGVTEDLSGEPAD